jgi:hypothetical protein
MAARLGLDPAEFLDKMKGVEGFTSGLNQRMSAEMKRTSREGAESFRLIDEALGIHVSRPLTRLLTSEFPAFAKALQSILGAAAVGALATIGFEAWEHLTKKIEEAKKNIDEFHAATANLQNVVENAADSWALKIAALGGRNSLAAVASEGADEARRQIDALGKAIDELYKKKVAAENWINKLWADTGGELTSTPKGKTEEANKQQFRDLQKRIDESLRADTLNGTTNAIKAIGQEIDANIAKTKELKQAMDENEKNPFAHPGLLTGKEQLEGLQSQREFLDQSKADESGREKYQGLKDAKDNAEAAKKAIHDLQEELKSWNQENNRAVEAWMKLNEEIDKSVQKLNSEAFMEFNKRAESQRAQFAPYLTQQVAPPPGAPMLPDQAELAKVTVDQNESWRKAGEILAQIETPAQKYAVGLATIRELEAQGRLNAGQMAQATQLLDQEMVKAADHVHKMQEELMKLLERSDSARDGLRAFWLELQINGAENGKFAFSFASTMFKDFEDGIAKTILATRSQHAELKRMWEGYFKSLEEMAIKFALTKSFASLANLGSSAGAAGGGGVSGITGLLAKLFGMGGGAGSGGGATTAAAGAGGGDIPLFAEGGDATPGSSFISGEAGAERVDLTRGGGARITPLGVKSGGSETHNYYDQRGSIVTDDVVRRAEAAQMMQQSEQRATARAVSMSQEIAKRSRPAR